MVKHDTNKVSNYFEYGIDVDQRVIFLTGDIEEDTISPAVQALYYLDSINNNDITLYVNSFGGSEYEMFRIYDTINTIKSKVSTVAMGKCMSAAPLIVAAGTKGMRYSTENTYFMIHEGWIDEDISLDNLKFSEAKKNMKHLFDLANKWSLLMQENTVKNSKFWTTLCKKGDVYITAEQAVEYGIIDTIWSKKNV